MPALRHIAVQVEEPRSGQFAWVLTEHTDGDWQLLDRAEATVRSYKLAMAQGLVALQLLVDDLDVGPRSGAGQQVVKPAAQKAASTRAATPAKGKFFGFGPAR